MVGTLRRTRELAFLSLICRIEQTMVLHINLGPGMTRHRESVQNPLQREPLLFHLKQRSWKLAMIYWRALLGFLVMQVPLYGMWLNFPKQLTSLNTNWCDKGCPTEFRHQDVGIQDPGLHTSTVNEWIILLCIPVRCTNNRRIEDYYCNGVLCMAAQKISGSIYTLQHNLNVNKRLESGISSL